MNGSPQSYIAGDICQYFFCLSFIISLYSVKITQESRSGKPVCCVQIVVTSNLAAALLD